MKPFVLRHFGPAALLLLFVSITPSRTFAFDDWQPISPDELKMTAEPAAPGASAVILYRQESSDDNENYKWDYYRIKILTEEGKKYADVKIPYDNQYFHITDLKARTIHLDGTVIPYDGKLMDSTLLKGRHLKILQKTFTLPDVQVGSIIEYKYRTRWEPGIAFAARWIVQDDLFQKRAKFSFAPFKHEVLVGGLSGSQVGYTTFLPPGSQLLHKYDHYDLEMSDVPAFTEEEYSPPSDDLKYRVRFYYERGNIRGPDDFWALESREWASTLGKFTSRSSHIDEQVRQLISPSDSADQKLRKLYAKVQQITNLTYQRERMAVEEKTLNFKENKNVDDVVRQNAGYHNQLTRVFVAMARSAGIEAHVVRVATRDQTFFSDRILDGSQLNSEVALVKLDGKDLYLDPGTRFCPYGLLEWKRTAVTGMLDNGGAQAKFVTTAYPELKNAVTQRVAVFSMNGSGDLKGQVRLVFTGQEALDHRLQDIENDDTTRKKDLEDELRRMLPPTATVHLVEAKGWDGVDDPLDALFSVEVPAFATTTGKRLLLTTSVFEVNSKTPFVHEKRVNPVYFEYPYRVLDQVMITVPASLEIESLPKEQKVIEEFAGYVATCKLEGHRVIFRRQLDVAGVMFPVQYYPKVKSFYEQVKSSDNETAILHVATVAKN